jgi:hypothetical protein
MWADQIELPRTLQLTITVRILMSESALLRKSIITERFLESHCGSQEEHQDIEFGAEPPNVPTDMNYQESLASWIEAGKQHGEILDSPDYFLVEAVDPLSRKSIYANVLGLAMVGMFHSIEAAVTARNEHQSTETVKIAADVLQIPISLALTVYWKQRRGASVDQIVELLQTTQLT